MEILDYFKLPKKAIIDQRIYVKDLIQFAEAVGPTKTMIEKSIDTIHLVGILTEDTSSIWKYEDESYLYEEIELIKVDLKDDSKFKQLNEEIQRVFPNPVIVVFEYKENYLLSTALKRKNKLDNKKSVIDSITTTEWFKLDSMHNDLLSKINYDKKNLKEFYEQIDYILSAEYVALITNNVPEVIDFTIKSKSIMIQELLAKKNELEEQEKEESSMQGKMQCYMQIKQIEETLEKMK